MALDPRAVTGTLYVVATPIGNLEDLSARAGRILAEAAVVLAEDTRVTAKLLARLGVATPMESFHDHNERERVAAVLARLSRGDDVALVSDAGTPLVSDPGFLLVREAAKAGIPVVPVPGPSAVMAALSVAGLPVVPFTFLGFFPRRGAEAAIAALPPDTVVFFEAPHRLRATLGLLARSAPHRPLVVARELTKLHEEVIRGSAAEILALLGEREPRGEIVLVLGPAPPSAPAPSEASLAARFAELTGGGLSRNEALRRLGRETRRPRRDLYRELVSGAGEVGPSGDDVDDGDDGEPSA